MREPVEQFYNAIPPLAGVTSPLLARLETLAVMHPSDAPVSSHCSFRPAQVLL